MAVESHGMIELVPLTFEDIDHFSEWSTGLGWSVESTQLSPSGNEIVYDHFEFPELVVGHYRVKSTMKDVFALPDGAVLFLICRAKLPVMWCGKEIPPTLMAVLPSGREMWVVLPGGWDCYEITVSEELIRRTGLLPPDYLAKTTQPERGFVQLMEPVTGQFLQRMDGFFEQGRRANGSLDRAVHRARFFDFIIDGLQQVIDAGLRASGSPVLRNSRRPDLVMKAREFVSAQVTTVSSVDEVAQALGVSYRVLNYAFRDSLGVSPYRYIQTEKLHAARRLLQRSDLSVSEACLSLGFQKPARFSEQYSRLFGELPSMTGRTRPRAAV